MQRVTESPNSLTTDLDAVDCPGIVRILRGADAQIFSGWKAHNGLYDEPAQETISSLVKLIQSTIQRKEKLQVIMSGAGTSGRLAHFAARAMNKAKGDATVQFDYLIAGGDLALIKSQEGAEDAVAQAKKELLEKIDKTCHTLLYIGITCGMSAPYVAGQLDWLMNAIDKKEVNAVPVLMGFNPVALSRSRVIEGWDKSFLDVATRLNDKAKSQQGFHILNPVIGPETVTGSTRMKSGSATSILLLTILCLGLGKGDESVLDVLTAYEKTYRSTYLPLESIANIVNRAGEALKRGAHVYYVGADTPGILGLIDASECPPTYGAKYTDVRGFVVGGWTTMDNYDGPMEKNGFEYRISAREFETEHVPRLVSDDIVIFLHTETSDVATMKTIAEKVAASENKPSVASCYWYKSASADAIREAHPGCLSTAIRLPAFDVIPNVSGYLDFSVKLVVNAVTTGAHVLAGRVYRNRMINLSISNNKLYYRAIDLVAGLLSVTESEAEVAVLRSIYLVDDVSEDVTKAPVSRHIEQATTRAKIVPLAMVLAGAKCGLKEARELLEKQQVVRNVILELVKQ